MAVAAELPFKLSHEPPDCDVICRFSLPQTACRAALRAASTEGRPAISGCISTLTLDGGQHGFVRRCAQLPPDLKRESFGPYISAVLTVS